MKVRVTIRWSGWVLLVLGALGPLGAETPSASAVLEEPAGITEEAPGGPLLVLDRKARSLVRVDRVTGESGVVSDDGTGGGPAFVTPEDVAVEASGSGVVVDSGLTAVLRVDLTTGDRSVVSDAVTGGGPTFVEPLSLAVETNGSIVVVDRSLAAVVRVDPGTGDRTVVSDADTGSGPVLEMPQGVEIEASGSLLVGDRQEGSRAASLYRVDATNGDRTLVSGATRGEGPSTGIVVDVSVLSDGRIVVADSSSRKQLLAVDPATGDRERLSGLGVGGGPSFEDPQGVIETATGLMVAEAGLGAVVRVDPVDGSRYVLGAAFSGAVTSIAVRRVVCRNETSGQQVQVETDDRAWDCEELGLAARPGDTVFTGAWGAVQLPGNGPQFVNPAGVALEADGGIVVADNVADAIFRVHPVTGDRRILSNDDTGSGTLFDNPTGIAVEADGSVLVTDQGNDSAIRVHPVTGDRTIVSDADHGGGLEFFKPLGIKVDDDGTVLVADNIIPGVFRVDPVTGDRTIVTGGRRRRRAGLLRPVGPGVRAGRESARDRLLPARRPSGRSENRGPHPDHGCSQ